MISSRTSNPGGSDLQFLKMEDGQPLYLHVAGLVADKWNANGQCGLVVGATFPNELAAVRQRIGDAVPLLVPGIGAQGRRHAHGEAKRPCPPPPGVAPPGPAMPVVDTATCAACAASTRRWPFPAPPVR